MPTVRQQTIGCDAEAYLSGFLQREGNSGRVVLDALQTINPLQKGSGVDEYLSYADRFLTMAGHFRSDLWQGNYQGLVNQLVLRSFNPKEVCESIDPDEPFASEDNINQIAELIFEGVEKLGGWEKFVPAA